MIRLRTINAYQLLIFILLFVLSAACLGPFIYLLITSFVTDMSQVFKNGVALKIEWNMLSLKSYQLLFTTNDDQYFLWFKNSIIVTTMFTVLSIVFCSMVGYGISMYDFKGKKIIIIMVLSTMMIPVETLMIPLYNEIKSFNLTNNYFGVVLPFPMSEAVHGRHDPRRH